MLLIHVKRASLADLVISGLLGTSVWRFSGYVQLVGDPVVDAEPAAEFYFLIWPESTSGSSRKNWRLSMEPTATSDRK